MGNRFGRAKRGPARKKGGNAKEAQEEEYKEEEEQEQEQDHAPVPVTRLKTMTPRPSLQWTQAHCSVPRLPEATFYPTWATRPPTSRVPSDVCAKSVQAMTYRVLRSSLYSSSEARCQHC